MPRLRERKRAVLDRHAQRIGAFCVRRAARENDYERGK
jgi:hypothetical protein